MQINFPSEIKEEEIEKNLLIFKKYHTHTSTKCHTTSDIDKYNDGFGYRMENYICAICSISYVQFAVQTIFALQNY